MAKKSFKLEDVEFNCTKNKIEPEKQKALLSDLQAMLDEESADKEIKNPKEYVILLSDPEGILSKETLDRLVGWPIQIYEGEDPTKVTEKLSLAAAQYNDTRSGKKTPATSIGDTIQGVTRKFLTENEIWPKAKEPVRVLSTDNKLLDLSQDEEQNVSNED